MIIDELRNKTLEMEDSLKRLEDAYLIELRKVASELGPKEAQTHMQFCASRFAVVESELVKSSFKQEVS